MPCDPSPFACIVAHHQLHHVFLANLCVKKDKERKTKSDDYNWRDVYVDFILCEVELCSGGHRSSCFLHLPTRAPCS